jgi:hypothetical protein
MTISVGYALSMSWLRWLQKHRAPPGLVLSYDERRQYIGLLRCDLVLIGLMPCDWLLSAL